MSSIKKVGIITFHASHNCGSMLQTYALKKILQDDFNCDVEIVDFSNKNQREMYAVFKKIINKGRLKENTKKLLCYPNIKRHYNDYEKFKNKYFQLSNNSYTDCKELSLVKWDYDIIICGSDQIWNVNIPDFDLAYFLPWIRTAKKVAYAPSLGGVNPIKEYSDTEQLKKCLEDFDKLSVREISGQEYLKEIINEKVQIMLDPTLVADSGIWDEICKDRLIKEEYIFYYSYGYYSKKVKKTMQQIAKTYNLPVYVINASFWYQESPKKYGFKMSKSGGPLAYLNLMKYAKYVFVESFHGIIFSTIFKKQFWLFDENKANLDSRLDCLLEQLQMRDRVLDPSNYVMGQVNSEIDYKRGNPKIDLLKKNSINFLKEAFELLD